MLRIFKPKDPEEPARKLRSPRPKEPGLDLFKALGPNPKKDHGGQKEQGAKKGEKAKLGLAKSQSDGRSRDHAEREDSGEDSKKTKSQETLRKSKSETQPLSKEAKLKKFSSKESKETKSKETKSNETKSKETKAKGVKSKETKSKEAKSQKPKSKGLKETTKQSPHSQPAAPAAAGSREHLVPRHAESGSASAGVCNGAARVGCIAPISAGALSSLSSSSIEFRWDLATPRSSLDTGPHGNSMLGHGGVSGRSINSELIPEEQESNNNLGEEDSAAEPVDEVAEEEEAEEEEAVEEEEEEGAASWSSDLSSSEFPLGAGANGREDSSGEGLGTAGVGEAAQGRASEADQRHGTQIQALAQGTPGAATDSPARNADNAAADVEGAVAVNQPLSVALSCPVEGAVEEQAVGAQGEEGRTTCHGQEEEEEEEEEEDEWAEGIAQALQLCASGDGAATLEALDSLRAFSREERSVRLAMVQAGVVPAMLELQGSQNQDMLVLALMVLLNLSFDPESASAMAETLTFVESGLAHASLAVNEAAAAVAFSLSRHDSYRGQLLTPATVGALVRVLVNGNEQGKRDSLKALFHLSYLPHSYPIFLQQGLVPPAVALLEPADSSLAEKATCLLSNVARCQEGCQAIVDCGESLTSLVEVMNEGSMLSMEFAAATLLLIAQSDPEQRRRLKEESPFIALNRLINTGTARAKVKASALLALIREQNQDSVGES